MARRRGSHSQPTSADHTKRAASSSSALPRSRTEGRGRDGGEGYLGRDASDAWCASNGRPAVSESMVRRPESAFEEGEGSLRAEDEDDYTAATAGQTGNTVFLRRHLSSGSSRHSEETKRFEENFVEDGGRGNSEGNGGKGASTGGVDIVRPDGYHGCPGSGRVTGRGSFFSDTMAMEEAPAVVDLPLGMSMDEGDPAFFLQRELPRRQRDKYKTKMKRDLPPLMIPSASATGNSGGVKRPGGKQGHQKRRPKGSSRRGRIQEPQELEGGDGTRDRAPNGGSSAGRVAIPSPSRKPSQRNPSQRNPSQRNPSQRNPSVAKKIDRQRTQEEKKANDEKDLRCWGNYGGEEDRDMLWSRGERSPSLRKEKSQDYAPENETKSDDVETPVGGIFDMETTPEADDAGTGTGTGHGDGDGDGGGGGGGGSSRGGPKVTRAPTSSSTEAEQKQKKGKQSPDADRVLQSLIKRDNSRRPLPGKIRDAQNSLASSLLGGKHIRLPELGLRYPQNVIILLTDAAEAIEHWMVRRQTAKVEKASGLPAWVTTWTSLQSVDLSRNALEGIEPLLRVTKTSSAGDGETPAASGLTESGDEVFPLAGLVELRLNGNALHTLPPDMDVTLPALEKLELYGNRIQELTIPRSPLVHLRSLNLGYNNLLALPPEACSVMPNLEVLLLPNNLLDWLPREITELKRLERLDVSRNPLTSPPVEVAARGLDSVKSYFLNIETKDTEQESYMEAPNEMKVFFIGHACAGKTSLIEGLMRHDRGGDSPGFRSSSIPVDNAPSLYGYSNQGRAGVHRTEFYDWAQQAPRTPSAMARAGDPERLRPALGEGGGWATPVSQPFWAARRWGVNPLSRDETEGDGDTLGFRQMEKSTRRNFEIGIKVWTPSPSRTPSMRVSDGGGRGGGGGGGGSCGGRKMIPGSSGGYKEVTDCNGNGGGTRDVPSGTAARSNGDITLKLWDFGGTEEFHAVHGLFFSGRALYMVVFDLRKMERSNEIDKQVQFWVDCVQTRVPGALIQLVGTHMDCMEQAKAKGLAEKVVKQLKQNEECIVSGLSGSNVARGLRHKRSRPNIQNTVLIVSCDTRQGFKALKKQIVALARDTKNFPGVRLPPLWGEADRLVKRWRKDGRNIMRLNELVDGLEGSVADSKRASSHTREDCRKTVVYTLNWLNDTSEVVYFNKPGLDEFVFMHPLMLMKAIKLIVRGDLDEHLRKLIIQSQSMEFVASGEGAGAAGTGVGYHGGHDGSQVPDGSLPQPAPISPLRSLPQQRPARSTSPNVPPRNGSGRGGKQAHAHAQRLSPRRSSRGAGRAAGAATGAGAGAGGGTTAGAVGGSLEASQGSRGSDNRWNKKQQSGSASNPNPAKSGSGVFGSGSGSGSGSVTGTTTSAGGGGATGQELRRHYSAGRGDNRRGQGKGRGQGQLRRHQSQRRGESGGTGANAGVGVWSAASRVVSDDRVAAAKPASSGSAPGAAGTGAGAGAAREVFGGDGPAIPLVQRASSERKCSVSKKDGDHLRNGFVSRTALEALLEPVKSWDSQAKQIVIDLLQESCVLVKVTTEKRDDASGSNASSSYGSRGKGLPRARSIDNALGWSKPPETAESTKYFIPCLLKEGTIKWNRSWMANVHCGRRWWFQRFVPPSLMSALISRFYAKLPEKTTHTQLRKNEISIRIPLTKPRRGPPIQAELFLSLYRRQLSTPLRTPRPPSASRLELWAQAPGRHVQDLMRLLEDFVKVVDCTLAEFPGLMVHRVVACPACMEEHPGKADMWAMFEVEEVEKNRSTPWNLYSCERDCRLGSQQQRLLFVGEVPEVDEGDEDLYSNRRYWDSPLPELGGTDEERIGGGKLHGSARTRGLGIPRVHSLFPAVCPIAAYNCRQRRIVCQATAFVVDKDRGLLLTAAHCFLFVGHRRPDGATRPKYLKDCSGTCCIILVGMLQPPYQYNTQWEYVAEAWQDPANVREHYSDIPWNRDHPLLLRIKFRFKRVSTREIHNIVFEDVREDWQVDPGAEVPTGLSQLTLGESRICTDDRVAISPRVMPQVLNAPGSDISMHMAVFPQELLTLVAWPQHIEPLYSSISVTHGPVARNMVGQDVIEVNLSSHSGASGGPVLTKRGEVVGILSQGSDVSAFVMGITTAKTILRSLDKSGDLELIYHAEPLYPFMNQQLQQKCADCTHAHGESSVTSPRESSHEPTPTAIPP